MSCTVAMSIWGSSSEISSPLEPAKQPTAMNKRLQDGTQTGGTWLRGAPALTSKPRDCQFVQGAQGPRQWEDPLTLHPQTWPPAHRRRYSRSSRPSAEHCHVPNVPASAPRGARDPPALPRGLSSTAGGEAASEPQLSWARVSQGRGRPPLHGSPGCSTARRGATWPLRCQHRLCPQLSSPYRSLLSISILVTTAGMAL